MTRSRFITVLLIAVLMGCLIAMTARTVEAEQVNFSLTSGESVPVGNYTLQFKGFTGSFPSYDLYYVRGSLLAHFPPDPLPPNWSVYVYENLSVYENVSIVTTAVSPDGVVVTGTITTTTIE